MKNNCKSKDKFINSETSSLARLRTIGAIDKYSNITNLPLFRKSNTEWSEYARKWYDVTDRLFSEENGKVYPNKEVFKKIDAQKIAQTRIIEWDENKRELQERIKELEEGNNLTFEQKKDIEISTASPETINRITEAAKQMGINIINLAKYTKEAKLNIKGINGLADVVKRVVAIAHGKEGEVLTEEVVHIATAMIEQTNPKLITELISKIDRFKIYKQVLDVYKNDKNYQLENGKPDIRKIKKEAVDKLIAEVIVNNSENEEQFPELREETNRNIIQKWWETIKDFIRGIYRKSNIDIFEAVGEKIIKGEVSPTETKAEGIYYDLSKIQPEDSYRRGEKLIIPKGFRILWHETTNQNPLFRDREVYNRLGYFTDSSILGEVNWGNLREMFNNRERLSDMERTRLFKDIFISFTRSLYGSTFNKRLAGRLGLERIDIVDVNSKPPMFAFKGHLYININKQDNFIEHLFSNSKEGNEWDLLDTMISEELIHLASDKLTTEKEELDAFAELTQEDKLHIIQTYTHNINETRTYLLNPHQYVHEYVRMQIQKKVLGSTTEEKRTALAKIINKVWDYLKDLLDSYKSLRNIYDKTLNFIETGEGRVYTGSEEELGIAKITKNDKVDAIYNVIVDKDKRLGGPFLATYNNDGTIKEKRHYTFDGEKVAKSVTEKVKENQHMPERTPEQKKFDDLKRDWGIEGHRFIENYITLNLIDKDGYIRKTPLTNEIETPLSEGQQEAISNFVKSLVYSYKEGTRILVERKVVNERVKGKLASTMDFLAIEPIEKENGETDVRVDVLDWKFIDIDKNKIDDVPHQKQKEWREQMGEYAKILYNYGVTYGQLRKQRMIPFIMNYEYSIKGKKDSSLVPTSIEVGDINNPKDTKMYLLSVPLLSESTGNSVVDNLIQSLEAHREKLFNKRGEFIEKPEKKAELKAIQKAIRTIHLQNDFKPLFSVVKTFMNSTERKLKMFEGIDYTKLSQTEIDIRLKELIEIKNSAEKFTNLGDVYLSTIDLKNATEEEKALLKNFRYYSESAESMINDIINLQSTYAKQLAVQEGFASTETGKDILEAEAAINTLSKTFLEGSKLPAKILAMGAHVWMVAKNIVNGRIAKEIDRYEKLLLPVLNEAKLKGIEAFNLIGEVRNGELRIFREIDSQFYKDIKQAKKDRNKKFLIENLDKEKYNKLTKDRIEQEIKNEEEREHSSNPEENERMKQWTINNIKNTYDIFSDTFNGYTSPEFDFIYNQCIKTEGHESKEFLQMSDDAKALWMFYREMNVRGKNRGYISGRNGGLSFMPQVEGVILEKLGQSKDFFASIGDILKDVYTVRPDEEQGYAKIDKETGKPVREIPKYFTRTNKPLELLSKDLGKIGPLWIKALFEYENAKEMESVLQTLYAVEKSKGSLILDENGKIIDEGGKPKVNKAENKNADIYKVMMDDYLYHLADDSGSLGNLKIKEITRKLVKDEEKAVEREVSVKKVINFMGIQVRVQAIGLKPLLSASNWMGVNFQNFIRSGGFYTHWEFRKNHAKITSTIGLSTVEKGLLHKFMVLNEDITHEKRRKLAGKQGFIKWLETWNFTDVMMSTMSVPERQLQFANALSFFENSTVIDGKIVNIRQYIKKQDEIRYAKDENGNYKMSYIERRALEKTYESRVQEMKEVQSLLKLAKIENDDIIIPGVSEKEIAKFRIKIVEYQRQLSGQMSQDNKAGFMRDSIFRSFMMFRTWVPPMVLARTQDIHKNYQTEEWEYGRMRVFFKVWSNMVNYNVFKISSILKGSDEGLKMLEDMLEQKRQEHYEKTGKQLEITQEEFNDLIRKKLSEEMKELGVLVSMLALLITAKAAQPPDDASDYEKNQYKWWAKLTNKIADEITFYYNPGTFSDITKGNIIPAMGLLTRIGQFTDALGREVTGYVIDDEEMIKKAYPVKYFLNLIPGAAQFDSELLPYIYPEGAKNLGIRVSPQSRPK